MNKLLCLIALAGCDSGSPGHTTNSLAVDCGGAPCAAGTVCCLDVSGRTSSYGCAEHCPDTSLTVLCDGPEDCGSSAPYCCSRYTLLPAPSTLPNCYSHGTISCSASCGTLAPTGNQCAGDGSARLCRVSADCADNGSYSYCCDSYCVEASERSGRTCS